ncbi:MAG: DUF4417 domain-containing protein [Fibrobacteraceae bacterium]|nr:DUF4417 domain-containing protein [Fibrobacteraceae bacterium]
MKTNKQKAITDDGFNPEFVKNAVFEGLFEFPILEKPKSIIIPDGFTPFSRRNEAPTNKEALDFFELDFKFADILRKPEIYVEELKKFPVVLPPDCSQYRDAPFYAQLLNVVRSRIIGHYFQSQGLNVYPLVRWGSEDTYTTKLLPEAVAFVGVPHDSIIVISTYGCIRSKDDKYHFEAGLHECLKIIKPRIVLVHGAMPDKVFEPYLRYAEFRQYPDWITRKKGGV